MAIRARFKIIELRTSAQAGMVKAVLTPIHSHGEEGFWKYLSKGVLEVHVEDPSNGDTFELDAEYDIDFTKIV